ncbi:MAG: NUDIX domain-containing protein, partial [Candidatus Uhrbacteria bacterium]
MRPFSEVAKEMEGKQGWRRGEGDDVFVHSKLGVVRHVVICRDDGTPLYDQFIHFEPIGAVTVPVNSKGELGLVRVERPTLKADVTGNTFPLLNVADLGVASLEFPRGFPKKGEAAAQTAAREGEEELGSPILGVEQIGELTPNTTFHPHRIPIFLVRVNEEFKGTLPPDVNEKILKVEW